MKRYLLIAVALCMCVAPLAQAQSYAFKILANKGSNKVKSGAAWAPVKTGASLSGADALQIAENAYVGLVHATGKTLELTSPGTYTVADLSAKLSGKGASVASKYADYVLNKISSESKKNRLSATGAVHRGSPENLKLYMPSSAEVYSDKVMVRWAAAEGNPGYQITLKNMFDDILIVEDINTPNYALDMGHEKVASQNVVLLEVKVQGDAGIKSGTYAIKRMPKASAERVSEALSALMQDVAGKSALDTYILGGFFEENGLLLDALDRYAMAMKLADDVDTYKNAYEDFLERNMLVY